MLPPVNRMTRSADFSSAVRDGRRARSATVVVHVQAAAASGEPVVGLVVSKAVGNSVVRHRVSRRLRAQLAPRLAGLPRGSSLVVRALPASAAAASVTLGSDLDRALSKALR